jgi:hypothetical protein
MDPNTTEVAEMMILRGGSFIQCLGQALLRADAINEFKIARTWPEEWVKYRDLAKEQKERK